MIPDYLSDNRKRKFGEDQTPSGEVTSSGAGFNAPYTTSTSPFGISSVGSSHHPYVSGASPPNISQSPYVSAAASSHYQTPNYGQQYYSYGSSNPSLVGEPNPNLTTSYVMPNAQNYPYGLMSSAPPAAAYMGGLPPQPIPSYPANTSYDYRSNVSHMPPLTGISPGMSNVSSRLPSIHSLQQQQSAYSGYNSPYHSNNDYVGNVSALSNVNTGGLLNSSNPVMPALDNNALYNSSASTTPGTNALPSYTRSKPRSASHPRSSSVQRASATPPGNTPSFSSPSISTDASVKDPRKNPNYAMQCVQWIRSFVPQADIGTTINALAQNNWEETAALSVLSRQFLNYDVSAQLQQHQAFTHGLPNIPSFIPKQETSNRTVQTQKRSIRDKYTQPSGGSPMVPAGETTPIPSYSRKPAKKPVEEDEFYDSGEESDVVVHRDTSALERTVLNFINVSSAKEISDTASCPLAHSKLLLEHRPFNNLYEASIIKHPDDIPSKPGRRGRRRPKIPMGQKIVNVCMETMEGYYAIDNLIARCEDLGKRISDGMASWGIKLKEASGELNIVDMDSLHNDPSFNASNYPGFITEQPASLAPDVKLKSYQMIGVNWMNLLYRLGLSGILADEMGLGKTCQVVAFFALLLEQGRTGPHLVVVPSSTLENWLRELARFCPRLRVEPYYGSQQERADIREAIEENNVTYDILVTTYQLATSSKEDRSFLKHQNFDVCVYDEGHYLKNRMSERYKNLMNLTANFRLLLTGTPLQNNLKELVSLLAFILPNMFDSDMEDLDVIFKAKPTADADIEQALLSKQRISRAKTMMTPFVLRRRKAQVLGDLPQKSHYIEYCDLSAEQEAIYNRYAAVQKSQQLKREDKRPKKAKKDEGNEANDKPASVGHTLMQLRKAANHALLFRENYDENILHKMAKDIMKEEQYKNANEQYIFEDMEIMSDFELHRLCRNFSTLQSYMLKNEPWMDSGKILKLKKMIPEMKEKGDRILLFSQFTQMLDILEQVLDTLKISYVRLDGSTQVETRQDIIDQFHREPDVTVFLLSTRAGGFGINLACANVVILYDCSYNPFDDLQAEDRAHRVGQMRDVRVIRLITKNTVEEYIQRLANTKLALDMSLSSDGKDREELGERLVQAMFDEENRDSDEDTKTDATEQTEHKEEPKKEEFKKEPENLKLEPNDDKANVDTPSQEKPLTNEDKVKPDEKKDEDTVGSENPSDGVAEAAQVSYGIEEGKESDDTASLATSEEKPSVADLSSKTNEEGHSKEV
ncbi:chromatin-remodeling complex ATPase chain Iswi [Schizosaccharomyces octosporus yFS286]|uniref:DNA helicase n=1 Tax=Schizosaccharomyces octosporus (strain yFS286) TaxID=483514 RepID=S9PWB4_SCHOY|nr:chromatin-remodeling complex ATPase chain Iswi [Schizosaccharomyces octosporus yFS286]EPX71773.1 chromatin-remodeling complex ATPase chain Iswi [Schizosaccharomyces octosporus yFS286]